MKITKRILFFAVSVFLLSIQSKVIAGEDFSAYVDKKGDISFPNDFRLSMIHLGSWLVPEGEASGFHDVYTERQSAEYFRKNGRFPDGATIVKELRSSSAKDMTTGKNVSRSTTTIKQWFVMVKDEKGRFSKNPIWGDGWGWALFKTDNPAKNATADYKNDCLGCHLPAQKTDLIYTEAYPMLTE